MPQACASGLCPYVFVFQAAVEKYDEVLHNLEFARELHKTLDGLTESVRDGTVLVSVYLGCGGMYMHIWRCADPTTGL